MARIQLTALTPEEAENRPVIHTGVSMMGLQGDDCVCGHCGRVMMTNFDIGPIRPDMVYICGNCDGASAAPPRQ